MAHRGKTQLNFCSETHQSFREHSNLFENTTIFSRTQQSFREHNEISWYTTIFFRTQRNFLIHNNLFQNTIKLSETQQNFKVLVTNSDAQTDRNLGLVLATWTLCNNHVPRVSHLTVWGERGETLVGSGHVLPCQLKTLGRGPL